MAETADVLSEPHQKVILPDLKAGCSMSDMARIEQVQDAWDEIGEYIDTSKVCPVTYMNSSAAIKAFCGEHGDTVSTSSNNRAIFEWAFAQGFEKIFFFPDQHLGRNTAFYQLGIPLEEIVLYDQSANSPSYEAKRNRRGRRCLKLRAAPLLPPSLEKSRIVRRSRSSRTSRLRRCARVPARSSAP